MRLGVREIDMFWGITKERVIQVSERLVGVKRFIDEYPFNETEN